MRLILHIGTPKTGTSAVQNHLFANREALLGWGLLYVRTGLFDKDAFGVRHKRLTHGGHDRPERWARLWRELERTEAHTAVISCEAFWRYPERAGELARRLAPHEVTVVAGLRRQDRFLASLHLQQVRQFDDRTPPAEMMAQRDGQMRYATALDAWAAAFGAEALRPFLYGESGQDVLPDFARAARLDPAGLAVAKTAGRSNVTPTAWTADEVLGADLARAVRERYRENNERLFATYVPDAAGWPEPGA